MRTKPPLPPAFPRIPPLFPSRFDICKITVYYFSLATKYKVFAKVFKESFIVLIHVNPTDKILKFALFSYVAN